MKSTAIVTGATTGIGREIALSLARTGKAVGIVGRNKEILIDTVKEIKKLGVSAEYFIADLSNQNSIYTLGSEILSWHKDISILINAAGAWHDNEKAFYGMEFSKIPIAQINYVLDVNLRATMLLTRLLIPSMIERKTGKVINISGTFAGGGERWLDYFVSKSAIESFTLGLAEELRKHLIQVNCISPSDVDTPSMRMFFPSDVNNALSTEKVAKLAMFLVDDEISADITGQIIVIKKCGSKWIVGHTN